MTNTGKALIITGLVLLLLVVLSFPMCGAVYCLCSQASTPPPRQHVSDEELNSLICNGPLVSKGSKLYSHCQNVKRQRSRLEGDPGYKARRDGNAKLPQREKERWINFYVKNLHKISGGSIVLNVVEMRYMQNKEGLHRPIAHLLDPRFSAQTHIYTPGCTVSVLTTFDAMDITTFLADEYELRLCFGHRPSNTGQL